MAVGVTALTGDVILVPTILLLGSFLVPVTMVMFTLARESEGHLTAEVPLLGFPRSREPSESSPPR